MVQAANLCKSDAGLQLHCHQGENGLDPEVFLGSKAVNST